MIYRPSSLLPLTISQLIRRAPCQLTQNSTGPSKRALPASLAGLVPHCTTDCLESFISTNYQASAYSNNLDLTCLCTNTTPSGLTIGEAALQCLVSVCPSRDAVDESSVYNICSGIPNAITETAGTITITMTTTSFLSVTTSTTLTYTLSPTLPSDLPGPSTSVDVSSSIVFDTGTPPVLSSSSSTSYSAISTGSSISASVTQPAAQTTSTLAAVSPTSSQQTKLTTGQIVGIAVGGGAAACFAFGVLMFVLCFRRSKKQRQRSPRWSMAIENPPPRPSTPTQDPGPARTTFPDPSDLTIGHSQRYYAAPMAEEKRRSFWRRSIKAEDIGVAVSPEGAQNGSPDSFSSQRTSSQLLPAPPNHALWPAPLRLSRQMPTHQGMMRPESTATVFEEDVARDMSTHQAITALQEQSDAESQQEMVQRVVPPSIGSGPTLDPRIQMYAPERATAAVTKSPITLTPVYDNGVSTPVYEKAKSNSTVPSSSEAFISSVPQPYSSSLSDEAPWRAPSLQSNAVHHKPLQTYSSAPNLPRVQQPYPRSSASTPSLSATTNYTDKRSTTASKGSIGSAGSDVTTFETDEDTTPEQELDKRLKPSILSPVIESPARQPADFSQQGSPIKGLQYPRVPRPAAVTRQAERPPRPRAASQINAAGPLPQPLRMAMTRDQLVHDERSFLQSQSTSRASPEPSVSLLAKRRGDKAADEMLQGGLKLSSNSANRTAPNNRNLQVTHPDDQLLLSPRKPKLMLDTRGSGVEHERASKRTSIGLTPTRRGGDLFLTVH